MPDVSLFHCLKFCRAGRRLVLGLPGLVRHAVDCLAALVLAHGEATLVCGILEPIGQAVSAEARQIHQCDVLDVSPLTQMRDQAPEHGRFEFCSGFVIDRHGRYPAFAVCRYDMGLVTDSAISRLKEGDWQIFGLPGTKTPLTVASGPRETIHGIIPVSSNDP